MMLRMEKTAYIEPPPIGERVPKIDGPLLCKAIAEHMKATGARRIPVRDMLALAIEAGVVPRATSKKGMAFAIKRHTGAWPGPKLTSSVSHGKRYWVVLADQPDERATP